jgi:hypothetical protein
VHAAFDYRVRFALDLITTNTICVSPT